LVGGDGNQSRTALLYLFLQGHELGQFAAAANDHSHGSGLNGGSSEFLQMRLGVCATRQPKPQKLKPKQPKAEPVIKKDPLILQINLGRAEMQREMEDKSTSSTQLVICLLIQ
jgi:hypothetical protein